MAVTTHLSFVDNMVLGALFDPEAIFSATAEFIDSETPGIDQSDLERIQSLEVEALLPLEHVNTKAEDIQTAINKLDAIITGYPAYASAWNNRAQARRLQFDIKEIGSNIDKIELILKDLSEAIRLASPTEATPAVSPRNARVLSSAHTHRASILWLASRSEQSVRSVLSSEVTFRDLNQDRLEEMASHEFSLGGKYGNNLARQLAVQTNPYAKLCGNIVRDAMVKEMADYYQN